MRKGNKRHISFNALNRSPPFVDPKVKGDYLGEYDRSHYRGYEEFVDPELSTLNPTGYIQGILGV